MFRLVACFPTDTRAETGGGGRLRRVRYTPTRRPYSDTRPSRRPPPSVATGPYASLRPLAPPPSHSRRSELTMSGTCAPAAAPSRTSDRSFGIGGSPKCSAKLRRTDAPRLCAPAP
eukprot:2203205-Prymnesium_polylepis.1